MSSSTEAPGRRVRLVRDAPVQELPTLQDLDALSDAARRVVDPAAMAEALAQGYAEGHEEGMAAGFAAGQEVAAAAAARQRDDVAAAATATLQSLAAASAEVLTRRDDTVAALERSLVDAAFELAEALLGRELEQATSPGRDALVRALRLAEGTDAVVARMHPDDIASLGDADLLAPGRELTVVADPTVERNGCLLQVGDGSVDAQISSALGRVREVLSS